MGSLATGDKKWKAIDEIHGHSFGYINDTAQKIVQNEMESDRNKLLKLGQLKEFARDLYKASLKSELRCKMLRTLSSELENGIDISGEGLRIKFDKYVSEINDKIIIQMDNDEILNGEPDFETVNKCIRLVERQNNDVDNDDEVQEDITASNDRVLRCPFLKCQLIDPYKNTKCSHVYSLVGLLQYLIQKHPESSVKPSKVDDIPSSWQVKCPVAGCGQMITGGVLKRDYGAELTQRQLQSSSGRRESMDVVDDVS